MHKCWCDSSINNNFDGSWVKYTKHFKGYYWKEQPIWIVPILPEINLFSEEADVIDCFNYENIDVTSYIKREFIECQVWEYNIKNYQDRKYKGFPSEIINL